MPGPNYTIFLRAQPLPALVLEAYAWPAKDPSETLVYAVDGLIWLAVNKMTLVSFTVAVNATLAVLGSGLMTSQGTATGVWLRLSGGMSGSTPTIVIHMQLLDEYGDPCIRVVTVALPIAIQTPGRLAFYPTSPVTLAPGATWYASFRGTFQIAPAWSLLATTEPANADTFYLNGGNVSIASNTTFFPGSSLNLAVGDLWTDGGTVICNGNPGLPTDADNPAVGTLVYNGGLLSLARRTVVPQSPLLLPSGATWYNSYRGASAIVPVWAALPTSEPANADAFWWNGGVLSIASNTTFLSSIPDGLPLGSLSNDGGIVLAAGNPGLPTSSLIPGTLLYTGGTLTLA